MNDWQSWYRLDRTEFCVDDLDCQGDDALYWADKSPQERMLALEYLRRIAYGDAATARLQRVFGVAKLGED